MKAVLFYFTRVPYILIKTSARISKLLTKFMLYKIDILYSNDRRRDNLL